MRVEHYGLLIGLNAMISCDAIAQFLYIVSCVMTIPSFVTPRVSAIVEDNSMAFPPYSIRVTVKATYSFSKFKDTFNGIKQNLKTVLNSKDTLPQALINKNFLKERQDEYVGKKYSSQEVSKIISRLKIKISSLNLKDIKSKIKIQDHKHAKGTSKEFLSIQGSKIQDVTRSKALSAMTTP
ncbi:hypothetical protein Tco_0928299 [Tanacetum coccineum]